VVPAIIYKNADMNSMMDPDSKLTLESKHLFSSKLITLYVLNSANH